MRPSRPGERAARGRRIDVPRIARFLLKTALRHGNVNSVQNFYVFRVAEANRSLR
jgi:hypothetical protein